MKKKLLITFCTLLLVSGCKDVKLNNGENAVVTFKEGGISSNELYKSLKDVYGGEKIMDLIDAYLLKDLYKETQDEKTYVKQTIKSVKENASSMGVDLNLYLSYYYGVADEDAFKDYLSLNYKRDLWKNDYAKEIVTDKQIEEYYDSEVYGDIDASMILITIDANSDDEDAKKEAENKALDKAKDIIAKLKDGEDFASLAKKNSEDESTAANGGSLGFVNSDDVNSEVWSALLNMKDGNYSSEPVKSSKGYYVLYRTSQKDKPELDDKLKETIIEKVAEEMASETGFSIKAQKALREKNEMKFIDTDLEKSYNELITAYEKQQSSN
ncbi:MAG: peptidylprolyl isomerase [bacterium]|nr:peptidylprolyl isomerase [bacterium]